MRLNTILTLSFCFLTLNLTGCGMADQLAQRCGGSLEMGCRAIFGDSLHEDVEQNQTDIKANEERIQVLERELGLFYSLVGSIEAELEQEIAGAQDHLDQLESLILGLQGDLAELQGRTTVEQFIDPCGDSPWFDEVLLRMNTGEIVAYFQSGGKRFLTVLQDGYYRTTDRQRCRFSIINGEYVE